MSFSSKDKRIGTGDMANKIPGTMRSLMIGTKIRKNRLVLTSLLSLSILYKAVDPPMKTVNPTAEKVNKSG